MSHKSSDGPDRWREPLAFSLGFISENPSLFESDENDRGRTNGFSKLAELLNERFKPSAAYTPSDIKAKIQDTWSRCGNNSDKTSDNLFLYGVHWRTLPGLEQKTNVSFEDVRSTIEDLRSREPLKQKSKITLPANRTEYASSRHPTRGKSSKSWVAKCICPFDTNDGFEWVQCDSCKAWQHVFCYYLLNLVDSHFCVDCTNTSATEIHAGSDGLLPNQTLVSLQALTIKGSPAAGLVTDDAKQPDNEELVTRLKLKVLQQQHQITNLKRALELQKSLNSLSTMTFNGDEPCVEGAPDNSDIQRMTANIEATLRSLVTTISVKEYWLDISKLKKQKPTHRDLESVVNHCLEGQVLISPDSPRRFTASDLVNFPSLLNFLVWKMICGWVFNAKVFERTPQDDPIYLAAMDALHASGDNALLKLRLAACSRVLELPSGWFSSFVEHLSAEFALRSLKILSNLIESLRFENNERPNPSLGAVDGAKLYLQKIFATCLIMKGRLNLRNALFRVDLPYPGAPYDPDLHDACLPEPEPFRPKQRKVRPKVHIALSSTMSYLEEGAAILSLSKTQLTTAMLDDCMSGQQDMNDAWKVFIKARVLLDKPKTA